MLAPLGSAGFAQARDAADRLGSLGAFVGGSETLAALALRVGLLVVVGVPFIFLGSRALRRFVAGRTNAQWGLLAEKLAFYPLLILLVATVLQELGFSLAPLLGAAGVAGVAIGFASQTSASNVISGFFLLGEQPFRVGDVVQVGGTVGRVMSIDTLSVKLRTFDNRFVRIPNETIIKSEVTTNTRLPIRRVDVSVGVAYREDVARACELLLEIAARDPRCLMEPEPQIFVDGLGDSAVDLRLGVWTATDAFLETRNRVYLEIKRRFDEEGIEIPFPHRTIYAGSASEPIRVEIAGSPAPSRSDPEASSD